MNPRGLRHFIPATPNRGTNMPFLSTRNTKLGYWRNACLFFLLSVAALECVRHQARWFILTVRIKYHAWCLRHSRVATPNRKNHQAFVQQSKFVFLVFKKGIFVPLLGVATLECDRHMVTTGRGH